MKLSIEDKLLLQQFFIGRSIKKAYLFGSYARNDATKDSDLDILVELDHTQPIGMKFFAYQSELEDILHRKVDLVSDEGLSRHVRPFIDHDKILIYQRSAH